MNNIEVTITRKTPAQIMHECATCRRPIDCVWDLLPMGEWPEFDAVWSAAAEYAEESELRRGFWDASRNTMRTYLLFVSEAIT